MCDPGVDKPCTVICRSPQWQLHDTEVWGKVNLGYLFMNRFAELMVRKPGAGVVSSLLATLLAPLVCRCNAMQYLTDRQTRPISLTNT
jgi:hypothetical protein